MLAFLITLKLHFYCISRSIVMGITCACAVIMFECECGSKRKETAYLNTYDRELFRIGLKCKTLSLGNIILNHLAIQSTKGMRIR